MSSIFKFDLATAIADARENHARRVFQSAGGEVNQLKAEHAAFVEKIRAAHAAGEERPAEGAAVPVVTREEPRAAPQPAPAPDQADLAPPQPTSGMDSFQMEPQLGYSDEDPYRGE